MKNSRWTNGERIARKKAVDEARGVGMKGKEVFEYASGSLNGKYPVRSPKAVEWKLWASRTHRNGHGNVMTQQQYDEIVMLGEPEPAQKSNVVTLILPEGHSTLLRYARSLGYHVEVIAGDLRLGVIK